MLREARLTEANVVEAMSGIRPPSASESREEHAAARENYGERDPCCAIQVMASCGLQGLRDPRHGTQVVVKV